jgi:hypothetical protein
VEEAAKRLVVLLMENALRLMYRTCACVYEQTLQNTQLYIYIYIYVYIELIIYSCILLYRINYMCIECNIMVMEIYIIIITLSLSLSLSLSL